MPDMTGIRVRHAKTCRTSESAEVRCNCSPTYEANVFDTRSNKKIRKSFPTYTAAHSWRVDALGALKRGTLRYEPTPTTLREAAAAFVAGMKDGSVRTKQGRVYKPSVIRGYEQALNSRGHEPMARETNARGQQVRRRALQRASILDDLGARKLSAIERRDLQGVIKRMLAAGCDPSTIRNALMPVRAIFRQAIQEELLVVNPTIGLILPAVTGERLRFADPLEAASLIAALQGADRALWATAIYSGLRLGELQALDVSCIDFAEGVIIVERSYDAKAHDFVDVKSSASQRRVPIPAALRTELRAHFARKLASGTPHGLVFGRTPELPFGRNNMHGRACTAWRKASLDPLGFHEARHTYASLMIASNVNVKAVSTYMGHASVNITLDRYGHLMPNDAERAAAQLDAYLADATGSA